MPDIIRDKPASFIKDRAFRIEIENCKAGSKTVSYHREDAEVDAEGKYLEPNTVKMTGSLVVPIDEVVSVSYDITNPYTQTTTAITGLDVMLWIEQHFVDCVLANDAKRKGVA